MRTAAFAATLLLILTACSTTDNSNASPYDQPNPLMATEISRRIEQIPYLHREELLENLLWLSQTGEQTISTLLDGLQHDHPKVRSSAAWVLGRIGDRRTIPQLQMAVNDSDPTVRLECARTLVLLGDLEHAPVLIEGLDSERKEVRYLCHEALKSSTGHDFGYDHLAVSQTEIRSSVLRWREWWSEYSGDELFASGYAQQHGLDAAAAQPAAPGGEVMPADPGQTQGQDEPPTPETVPPVQPESQPAPQPNESQSGESPAGATEIPVVEIEMPPVPHEVPAGSQSGSGNPGGNGSKGSDGNR